MPFKANDGYSSMPQYNEIILGDGIGATGGGPRCGVLTMTPGPGANQADGVGGANASYNGTTNTLTLSNDGSTYSTCGLKSNNTIGSITVNTINVTGTFSPGSQMIIELLQTSNGLITVDVTTLSLQFNGGAGSTRKRLDGASSIATSTNGNIVLITLYRGCGPNNTGGAPSAGDLTYITANHYVN
jgi:hypothetical protein